MVELQVSVRTAELRAGTAALLEWIDARAFSDTDVRAPSGLPDWTRAHVLTHLARNADAIAASLSAALRGEVRPMYPDGPEARNADIQAGAVRPAAELVTDVHEAVDRLDRVVGAVSDVDGWHRPAHLGGPARDLLDARWREVEIHRVDLASGYGPSDWPGEFVAFLLAEVLATAAERLPADVPTVRIAIDGTAERLLSPTGPDGPAVAVAGPDWAVLAWLIGRPVAGALNLDPPPALAAWR